MDRYQTNLPVSENEVVNPICVILVKNGSKGDRLLFRYPSVPEEEIKKIDETSGFGSSKFSPASKTAQQSPSLKSTNFNNESAKPSNESSIKSTNNNEAVKKLNFNNEVSRTSNLNNEFKIRNYLNNSENIVDKPKLRFRRSLTSSPSPVSEVKKELRNPYAICKIETAKSPDSAIKSLGNGLQPPKILLDLSDKDLSNLLAVSTELSEKKFELKVNDVRFVGHPILLQHPSIVRPINTLYQTSTRVFHIVFCLHAMASHSIVKCFHDLSKRLGIALRHEEYRTGYLSQEMKKIITILDESSQEHEEADTQFERNYFSRSFAKILPASLLGETLKKVYDDVTDTGFVKVKINGWTQLTFCLPQKIHVLPFRDPCLLVEPENIHKCLESIRPYHALLLLVDREELAASFWLDSSSTIPRMLQVYSPLKSFQCIAADADLSLSQVVEIASHLVYWAVATIIYPICESNTYVISPDAPITNPDLEEAFLDYFPGLSLSQTLADFSLPMPLGERANPVLGGSYLQAQVVHLVSWLLQNRLLIQLHTFIYLSPYIDDNGVDNCLSSMKQYLPAPVLPYEHEEDELTLSDTYSESYSENGATKSASVPPLKENEGEKGVENESLSEEVLGELSSFTRRAVEIVRSRKIGITALEVRLFAKLSKYFTGESHFEEIMYRENVRRSQLLLILDKFRDVLFTLEKEDSTINFFIPQN